MNGRMADPTACHQQPLALHLLPLSRLALHPSRPTPTPIQRQLLIVLIQCLSTRPPSHRPPPSFHQLSRATTTDWALRILTASVIHPSATATSTSLTLARNTTPAASQQRSIKSRSTHHQRSNTANGDDFASHHYFHKSPSYYIISYPRC